MTFLNDLNYLLYITVKKKKALKLSYYTHQSIDIVNKSNRNTHLNLELYLTYLTLNQIIILSI